MFSVYIRNLQQVHEQFYVVFSLNDVVILTEQTDLTSQFGCVRAKYINNNKVL